jgi:hypothetical protein
MNLIKRDKLFEKLIAFQRKMFPQMIEEVEITQPSTFVEFTKMKQQQRTKNKNKKRENKNIIKQIQREDKIDKTSALIKSLDPAVKKTLKDKMEQLKRSMNK